jgi:predicted phosphodiesterase
VRRALISDIHANLEGLEAVLEDIRGQQVDQIYCLGDIIGYGPNPCECLDLVMENCELTILGNHDQAALIDPDGFNPVALGAVYWTRDQLEKEITQSEQGSRRWDFIGELPTHEQKGDFLFVHGSPREPTNEYIFPEDVYNHTKLVSLFERVDQYCFQGHTHIPGIFTEDRDFISPEECDNQYRLGQSKIMVNVGSVGQPRDENPCSCYVILDDVKNLLTYRRVKYPCQQTADKIFKIPELDDMLGNRLLTGR